MNKPDIADLKSHLTPDDGNELWDIGDKIEAEVKRIRRGEDPDSEVLQFQAHRCHRLAKIADQGEMPLPYTGTDPIT